MYPKAAEPREMTEEEKRIFDSLPKKQEPGVISQEGIERARARIGIVQPRADRAPFNEVCNKDALRKAAQAIGDINPLWWNEEYGEKTRWGSIIGPPTFFHSMGISLRTEPLTPEERTAGAGALTGVHGWYSGDYCQWFRPIRLGDRLYVKRYVSDVILKRSELAGVTVHNWHRAEYTNQDRELIGFRDMNIISGGRERKSGERTKYADLQKASYTPEDIARIDADCEKQVIRGATPRYWEDVKVGDELTPVLKGPLTICDMINWDIGFGMTMFDGAGDWAYQYRKRHPAALPIRKDSGVPDTVERVHWSDDLAIETGNPVGAYDYGEQRSAWLLHVLTNWMGDDAWISYFDDQFRLFVYVFDTVWVWGKVTRKYIEDGECRVDVQMGVRDQRGRETAPANATIILPSRQHGPVKIPPKGIPAGYR